MLHTNVLKVASVSLLIKKQVLNDSLLCCDGELFLKDQINLILCALFFFVKTWHSPYPLTAGIGCCCYKVNWIHMYLVWIFLSSDMNRHKEFCALFYFMVSETASDTLRNFAHVNKLPDEVENAHL